jgi:hypothetical protein
MNTFVIILTITLSVTISVILKIKGHIDLNKIFNNIFQWYITKKYNKKANDYNKLFYYFHPNLIKSPSGELVNFLMEHYNTMEYYPDYKKKKIFVLKNDKKRKSKANKIYSMVLNGSQLRNIYSLPLEEKEKFCKADFYCHKELSKNFKYFLELTELIEKNHTFQQIVQSKWYYEY